MSAAALADTTGSGVGGSTAPGSPPPAPAKYLKVLLYSDDSAVRERLRAALGTRPDQALPELSVEEFATAPALIARMDLAAARRVDLVVLDGEAVPAGGMGLARQLKDEIYQCPPLLVVTGRAQDGWLATWARADAVVSHPIDPVRLADVAVGLLRPRVG